MLVTPGLHFVPRQHATGPEPAPRRAPRINYADAANLRVLRSPRRLALAAWFAGAVLQAGAVGAQTATASPGPAPALRPIDIPSYRSSPCRTACT